jgi:hypothetical protein
MFLNYQSRLQLACHWTGRPRRWAWPQLATIMYNWAKTETPADYLGGITTHSTKFKEGQLPIETAMWDNFKAWGKFLYNALDINMNIMQTGKVDVHCGAPHFEVDGVTVTVIGCLSAWISRSHFHHQRSAPTWGIIAVPCTYPDCISYCVPPLSLRLGTQAWGGSPSTWRLHCSSCRACSPSLPVSGSTEGRSIKGKAGRKRGHIIKEPQCDEKKIDSNVGHLARSKQDPVWVLPEPYFP